MATGTAGSTARDYSKQLNHYLRKGIVFGDNGSTLDVGVVPIGAVVVEAMVVVSTAFNGNATNTCDIGTAADTDGFATILALGTIGRILADEMATSNDLGPYTADTTIQCVVTSTAAATAGAGEVIVVYVLDNDR